jgi:ADP-heptose:LPS heptosyltransferase
MVYLIRKRALGDVLWIEPIIRQLAAQNRKIVVYTKYNGIFLNYPIPNVVFRSSLTKWEKIPMLLERLFRLSFFFIDLDRSYERDPKIHFLFAYQDKAGLTRKEEYPKLYLSEHEKAYQPPVPGKYVILHLESLAEKNYRKVFGIRWETVIKHVTDKGFTVIQIGKSPTPIPGTLLVKTDLREMIALINKASFFIGIDSGPSHLAASLQIPSLIFFGAVNPEFRHFKGLFKGRILQQYCEFAGCFHESPDPTYHTCRLVGDQGIPKCSLHTTEYVLNNIDLLISDYKIV